MAISNVTARNLVGLGPAVDGLLQVTVRVLPGGRLNRRDAATFLGVAPKTLASWKSQRKGPPAFKVGGRDFYFVRDLKAFVAGEE